MPFIRHKTCYLYKNIQRENDNRIENWRFGSTHTVWQQNCLGSKRGWKEKNIASSLLEYEVLKPSDFLHSDIINYIVVTVGKGMMFLGESC